MLSVKVRRISIITAVPLISKARTRLVDCDVVVHGVVGVGIGLLDVCVVGDGEGGQSTEQAASSHQ